MGKRLAKTADVARAWATQSQDGGHATSASFAGPRLISYSTCVAQIVETADLRLVALICENRWSTTTAAFLSEAVKAANDAGLGVFRTWSADPREHVVNVKNYARRAQEAVDAIERARVPDHHRQNARRILDELEAYRGAFGLDLPTLYAGPPPETILSAQERRRQGSR